MKGGASPRRQPAGWSDLPGLFLRSQAGEHRPRLGATASRGPAGGTRLEAGEGGDSGRGPWLQLLQPACALFAPWCPSAHYRTGPPLVLRRHRVKRDKAFIADQLEMMQSFFLVAHEKRGERNKVARTWVKQVHYVACGVEDSLQDIVVHVNKQSWWCIPGTLLNRRHVAKKMKDLRTKRPSGTCLCSSQ